MAAITSRTSFGVAGVEAIDRFQVDATRIAVFTSVQVGVYAFAQIPMGILIDKFGPRKLLAIGALVMGIGQLILGFTDSYSIAIIARVFIGAGDASIFLSVMRILPFWFPLKHTPIFTQLTTCLGQLGQFFSAVPFMALLGAQGWPVAFVSLVPWWHSLRSQRWWPFGILQILSQNLSNQLRKQINQACARV